MYQQIPQVKFIPQIDDLQLIEFLGKGSYGEVYLSKKVNSNQIFATKKMNKQEVDTNIKKYFDMEINILKYLNHPNIIKLYEVKSTQNNYYIVTEYANGGTLSNCLKQYISIYKKAFPESIVQHLMLQIVSAVAYMHNCFVIHRDLKTENIMVHFDSEKDKKDLNMMKAKIKIIDFGFAFQLSNKNPSAFTLLGTPPYMAPEIIIPYNKQNQNMDDYYKSSEMGTKMVDIYFNQGLGDINRGYGLEVDIWSLGCICYELFTGQFPFAGRTMPSIIDKIDKGQYLIPNDASPEIKSFLDKMLIYDGKYRISAKDLLIEPFLINFPKDLIEENSNSSYTFEIPKDQIFKYKDSIELYREKMKQNQNYKKNNSEELSEKTLEEIYRIAHEESLPGPYQFTGSGVIIINEPPQNQNNHTSSSAIYESGSESQQSSNEPIYYGEVQSVNSIKVPDSFL